MHLPTHKYIYSISFTVLYIMLKFAKIREPLVSAEIVVPIDHIFCDITFSTDISKVTTSIFQ